MSGGKKKICHCKPTCGKLRAQRTRRRHYKRTNTAEQAPSKSVSSDVEMDPFMSSVPSTNPPPISQSSFDASSDNNSDVSDIIMEAESDSVVESFDDSASHISDISIDSDSSSCSLQEADFIDSEDWVKFDEELDSDIPKTLEEMQQELDEMVFPEEEQTLWEIRNNILTDADRDNVRAFKLQLASGMSRSAFAQMRYAFRHQLEISSHWAMIHRIAILARVQPDWYNCCPNSCLAYTGHYADLTHCCFCAEPCFTPTNKPRRLFCYLPVIPRLQAFFSNPLTPSSTAITTNTVPAKYRTFLMVYITEIYAAPKSPSMTVNSLTVTSWASVISGPNTPKDPGSYLVPFEEECVKLAIGVPTYNCITNEVFNFHVYNIFGMGDMIEMLNVKGHNGFCPCRSCKIKGNTLARGIPVTSPYALIVIGLIS
ncbi:hypothetical protein DFH07DRAFT_1067838 [Mycena maculata]|uniref:Uncharacterized protein n=1 Tax=Mycena maculata TaxID=230809 RepID=A0AAD7HGK9_9AGAR|nr:hypothetical protein DFH07DRAFT_1067838 [Mycena maculata]